MSQVKFTEQGASVRLLACVNGSSHSLPAFWAARRMARDRDQLHIVAAVKSDDEHRYATKFMEKMKVFCKNDHLLDTIDIFTLVLQVNNAPQAILKYADRHEIDHIFVGTRQLSSIKKVLMGSFSSHIANHAQCSVTIMKQSTSFTRFGGDESRPNCTEPDSV